MPNTYSQDSDTVFIILPKLSHDNVNKVQTLSFKLRDLTKILHFGITAICIVPPFSQARLCKSFAINDCLKSRTHGHHQML